MMGSKVTCGTCRNEENRKCVVKKSKVAVNKRRHCGKYIFEATKVKAKQILKTIKMGHQEKEALRKEYKEQLKLAKAAIKNPGTTAHPLTGDLSRFTSTVGNNSRGG
jgi:hypothetical protein